MGNGALDLAVPVVRGETRRFIIGVVTLGLRPLVAQLDEGTDQVEIRRHEHEASELAYSICQFFRRWTQHATARESLKDSNAKVCLRRSNAQNALATS